MSKNRINLPQRDSSGPRRGGGPGTAIRVLVSVLLIWHVAAVFLAPMSIPPSSQLIRNVAQGSIMQWYLDALYINHGYYFFAPDPGIGRIVRYEVFDQGGSLARQGELPNRETHWPRLFYHRYFMLADQAGNGLENPDNPMNGPRRFLEAYARHLLRKFDGESVRLRWIEHEQPNPYRVRTPVKLDDPSSYKMILEVIQRRSDLKNEPTAVSASEDLRRQDTAGRWTGATR